jgi:hypothetical protein
LQAVTAPASGGVLRVKESGHVHLSEMPAAAFVTQPEVHVQVDAPAAEVAPPGHAGHTSVVALDPCVYEFGWHTHAVLRVAFTEAELGGHAKQLAAPEPYMKVLSAHGAQEASDCEPVVFTAVPGGHATHEAWPPSGWYWPATHGVHVAAAAELWPSGPIVPLAQALPRQLARPAAFA